MGQPLLGDGVRADSKGSRPSVRQPLLSSAISPAVMRAGSQASASSARAAHWPAQRQSRPPRAPR